jgi:hypothetical protein
MIDGFINGFCKVEFLCYAGDPNRLGWVVLVIGGLLLWSVGLAIGLMFFGKIIELYDEEPWTLIAFGAIIAAIVGYFVLEGLGLFD